MKKMNPTCLLLISLVFSALVPYQGNSQSIRRQSISSYGAVVSSESAVAGQTAGQCYSTSASFGNSIAILPGFQQSSSFKVEEITPTSVFNISNVRVYPNPATYMLTVSSLSDTALSSVIITDMNGKTVLTEEIPVLHTHHIQCESLNNGIYFVIITDENQNRTTVKLIISK